MAVSSVTGWWLPAAVVAAVLFAWGSTAWVFSGCLLSWLLRCCVLW
jgi:hypothetical protein